MTRPVCVHCGKAYGQRDTHSLTLRWENGEPEPRYTGNLTVVRHGDVRKSRGAMTFPEATFESTGGLPRSPFGKRTVDVQAQPNARDIEVWDGRTWFGGYEPFCTLRCALDYARIAYRNRSVR